MVGNLLATESGISSGWNPGILICEPAGPRTTEAYRVALRRRGVFGGAGGLGSWTESFLGNARLL